MQITDGEDLQNIVLNAPIGICILDAATLTGEIVNNKFLEVAGKPYETIAGKFYWDAFAEVRPYYEATLNDVVNSGTPYYANDVELMLIRHGKKEKIFVTFFYSPIKNSEGKVTKVAIWVLENTIENTSRLKLEQSASELQAINEEMTAMNEELASSNEEMAATNEELASANMELALAHANLRRSERLFRSIVLNIPNCLIVVIDKEHRYITVEGDLMEKMGYERKDYEGKHPSEISHERYEASKHLFEKMMAGEHFSIERKGVGGEDYLTRFVPLKNELDEIDAGMMILFDVSDIKRAEEKSAQLGAIVESSDDAIISKTLESVITSWNESAERIFGYKAEEIIGDTIYRLIPLDRQNEEPKILSRLKIGERVEHFETKRLTKDGKLIDVSVTVSPVKDKSGNIIGLSKIARDITERKLDEGRKNDFIGMASHELKTPLTSLSAIIQVVQAKLKNTGDVFLIGAMDKANLQVKRMTAMINGFLNISRLEAGKILIEKQPVELSALLNEILEETRLVVSSHEIVFLECSPVSIHADPDRISSVVSNLISNAVKYSPKGKRITIDCNKKGDVVIVSVKDEGMGIKPQDSSQIFDRYYRVEGNHTRHISGFGIGLYLSDEIIKRHGGEIWVESESGKGSTFSFSLPMD